MKKLLICLLGLNAFLLAARVWQELPVNAAAGDPVATRNGDVDGTGEIDITDAVYLLNWLFLGGEAPVAFAEGTVLTPEQAEILRHMSLVRLDDGQGDSVDTIRFTGVNVQVVNGTGATDGKVNGSGNLIIGYQEFRTNPNFLGDDRTGSHNLVVGSCHNYTSFGGMVVGIYSTISGIYSSVTGGFQNTASGRSSSVSGGYRNTAVAEESSISGGVTNLTTGADSHVSGGQNNEAAGAMATVCGGGGEDLSFANVASGAYSCIVGGARVKIDAPQRTGTSVLEISGSP